MLQFECTFPLRVTYDEHVASLSRIRDTRSRIVAPQAKTVIRARETGRLTHAQLQRRWTSRENPLKERKTQLMIAAKIAAEELEQKEKK